MRTRWPIVLAWNVAALLLFLAAPYDWKFPLALACGIGMLIHLRERTKDDRGED